MEKGKFSYTEDSDGSIRISYEDYKVEAFGGGSYEAIYDIDAENRQMLEALLRKTLSGSLQDMITEEFGEYLDKKSFHDYCEQYGVECKVFTWIDD